MKTRTPIRVLVTGGPTRAYLDKVRFLSNVSTGALSFSICDALCRQGVQVALIAGPTAQPFSKLRLKRLVEVETTTQMEQQVLKLCQSFRPHFAIFSAAVLDFVPDQVLDNKVSSDQSEWRLVLRPTRKIIDEVGIQFPNIRRIGFKLEWQRTNDVEHMALSYLQKKNLDGLCINFLSEIKGAKHPAIFFPHEGKPVQVGSKKQIASVITNFVLSSL